jgi:D-glycero-alpha-D-manno-heptose-7-phosphate kinase
MGIELVSIADVPSNCGLGTSSSFTVSLLNALHNYKRDFVNQKQLAQEACHIEIDILKEPIGKQDQYIAAFGGLTCLTFEKDGEVIVEPLKISNEGLDRLEGNILLFHTGIERSASEILAEQDTKSQKDDPDMVENLHRIKEIGLETRRVLEKGDIDALGELLHVHWETKRKRSNNITSPFIDECYETARKSGALGGKIMGAGGGGFFMFYCNNSDKARMSQAMKKMGLKLMKFRFDFEGAKILVNMKSL